MANMQDDERERFEAWAKERDSMHGGTIVSDERGLDYPLGRLLWEAWQARASLPPAPEPVAGWQWVPKEPTVEMAQALIDYKGDQEMQWPDNVSPNYALAAYRIMLAAAPTKGTE